MCDIERLVALIAPDPLLSLVLMFRTSRSQSVTVTLSAGPSFRSARASTKAYTGCSRASVWMISLKRSKSRAFTIAGTLVAAAPSRTFRLRRIGRYLPRLGLRRSERPHTIGDLHQLLQRHVRALETSIGRTPVRDRGRAAVVRLDPRRLEARRGYRLRRVEVDSRRSERGTGSAS